MNININIIIWHHDYAYEVAYARRLYRKRKLSSRICSHLFEIDGEYDMSLLTLKTVVSPYCFNGTYDSFRD